MADPLAVRGLRKGRTVTVRCHYCGAEYPADSRLIWRRVTGWERRAHRDSTRKGGSDIACRRPLEDYACDPCVGKLRRGLSPDQGELL